MIHIKAFLLAIFYLAPMPAYHPAPRFTLEHVCLELRGQTLCYIPSVDPVPAPTHHGAYYWE